MELHVSCLCAPPPSEPGGGERGTSPGLLQQPPHAGIGTLESTSIPTGDVEFSMSHQTQKIEKEVVRKIRKM